MKHVRITDVAKIVTNRVPCDRLSVETYISTTNMQADFGGVTDAISLPSIMVTSFKQGDILISNIGPHLKKIWFARFDGGCSTDVICLRVTNTDCLPKYLFYQLNTDKFIYTFIASRKGTTIPRGDKQTLLLYGFFMPNLIEQQHIVDLIGSLDEKVENNIMLAQKFNDYLNALFSQFSVNAPTTPIGEIIKKVGKLCKNNEWKGQPVIDLSSMPRSNVVISNYSNGDKFTTNIHTLSDNTLLYGSIRPYFKKCGFAVGVSFVTGTVHSFKAINESLYYWILSVIQSEDFHNFCVIKSQGTKMPVIKWEAFSSIEIPLPSGDELEKFNTLIAPLYYKVSQGIIENRKLKELKEYYLKRYFI